MCLQMPSPIAYPSSPPSFCWYGLRCFLPAFVPLQQCCPGFGQFFCGSLFSYCLFMLFLYASLLIFACHFFFVFLYCSSSCKVLDLFFFVYMMHFASFFRWIACFYWSQLSLLVPHYGILVPRLLWALYLAFASLLSFQGPI